MEYITDVNQALEIKKLGEYHDLCVQNGTLLLADVFENFRNMPLEIHEPNPAKSQQHFIVSIFKKRRK